MNTNDFDSDNIIKFKALADRFESCTCADKSDFEADILNDNGLLDFFSQILSESLSEPYEALSEEDLFEEIVDNFFVIINELGIDKFSFFRFSRYDYHRELIIDGKAYDLDCAFSHDDIKATEALYAIDCLIADLGDDIENTLKNIEKKINLRNKV